MPLKQIARTPKTDYPPRPNGAPYAFAYEIRNVPLGPAGMFAPVVMVRCPWCPSEHAARPGDNGDACATVGRRFVVAIPAGIPVLE